MHNKIFFKRARVSRKASLKINRT